MYRAHSEWISTRSVIRCISFVIRVPFVRNTAAGEYPHSWTATSLLRPSSSRNIVDETRFPRVEKQCSALRNRRGERHPGRCAPGEAHLTASDGEDRYACGAARRVDRRARRLLDRKPRTVRLERAESPRANRAGAEVDRLVAVAARVLRPAQHHRGGAFVGAAEHVLPERIVQHRRCEDLLL